MVVSKETKSLNCFTINKTDQSNVNNIKSTLSNKMTITGYTLGRVSPHSDYHLHFKRTLMCFLKSPYIRNGTVTLFDRPVLAAASAFLFPFLVLI